MASIEKFSLYEFEVFDDNTVGYHYIIYDHDFTSKTMLRESDDCYDTEQEARFAAIGHITLLENGEG